LRLRRWSCGIAVIRVGEGHGSESCDDVAVDPPRGTALPAGGTALLAGGTALPVDGTPVSAGGTTYTSGGTALPAGSTALPVGSRPTIEPTGSTHTLPVHAVHGSDTCLLNELYNVGDHC
jgi:hypothetical protein